MNGVWTGVEQCDGQELGDVTDLGDYMTDGLHLSKWVWTGCGAVWSGVGFFLCVFACTHGAAGCGQVPICAMGSTAQATRPREPNRPYRPYPYRRFGQYLYADIMIYNFRRLALQAMGELLLEAEVEGAGFPQPGGWLLAIHRFVLFT